jgi:hypothetical protein
MTALASVDSVDLGQVIDPNASPAGSIDTNTTPDTEFSPPETPIRRSGDPKDARTLAKAKLATLTTEEKVCCVAGPVSMVLRADLQQVSLLAAADFWRTKAIPEKNVPAVKTTDGPNGARGGIFVGGTKVSFQIRRLVTFHRADHCTGRAFPVRHLASSNMEQGHPLPSWPAPGGRGQGPVSRCSPRANCLHAQTPAGRAEL